MERSVVIFGSLSFPAKDGVGAWREQLADPAQHRDWKGDFQYGKLTGRRVAELLETFPSFEGEQFPPGRVEVKLGPRTVQVRGYLDDDGVARWGNLVLSAFRAAAAVGATGRIHAVQPQEAFGHAVELEGGKSRLSMLPSKALPELLETREAKEAAALLWAKYPKLDTAAMEQLVQQRLPPERQGDAYARLVDALARAPATKLLAGAKALEKRGLGLVTIDPKTQRPTAAVVGRRDVKRVTELWPTAARLLEALREGATSEVRFIAVHCAGVLAPRGAIEHVADLLREKPDGDVVSAGFDVLRRAKHPRATELLLDIVRDPPTGVHQPGAVTSAAMALARTGDPGSLRALEALVTPAALEAPSGTLLAHSVLDAHVVAKRRCKPETLLTLWACAKDTNLRNQVARLLFDTDRSTLARAVELATSDAERKAMETARKRARPAKKSKRR